MSELILKHKLDKLESFRKDASWYRAHYIRLKRQYGGKYIAINKGDIIVDNDHDNLLRRLRNRKYKNRTFVIKYISKRDAYRTS
jgi:ABC-type phosphate/phosphonate transport system ATPase subunit